MTDLERELGASIAIGTEEGSRSERRSVFGSIGSLPPWVSGLIGIAVIVAIWWIVSATYFGRTQLLPLPYKVAWQFLLDLADPIYWKAIGVTALSALWGYIIGNLIAFLLAFLVLILPWFEGLATQLAVVTSCIPLTAIAPIVTLMSHPGQRSTAVFLAGLSVVFTTVVGALLGLRAASETQLDVVHAYGGSRLTAFTKVQVIAALPSVMASLKLAAPAAFLGSVLGEYFLQGVDSGLGILLIAKQQSNSAAELWSLALICGGVAGLAYWAIGALSKLVTPWSSGDAQTGDVF